MNKTRKPTSGKKVLGKEQEDAMGLISKCVRMSLVGLRLLRHVSLVNQQSLRMGPDPIQHYTISTKAAYSGNSSAHLHSVIHRRPFLLYSIVLL